MQIPETVLGFEEEYAGVFVFPLRESEDYNNYLFEPIAKSADKRFLVNSTCNYFSPYNGIRLYMDSAHPEVAIPECSNAFEVLLFSKAGERFLAELEKKAEEILEKDGRLKGGFEIFRCTRDFASNSFGCHYAVQISYRLGYVCAQSLTFEYSREQALLGNAVIASTVFTNSGCIAVGPSGVKLLASQRGQFINYFYSSSPGASILAYRDAKTYSAGGSKRIEVGAHDSNMCEIPVFLAAGVLSLMVKALEHGLADKLSKNEIEALSFEHGIDVLHQMAEDLTLQKKFKTLSNKEKSAVDLMADYFDLIEDFLPAEALTDVDKDVLRIGRKVLKKLKSKNAKSELFGWLDLQTKMVLMDQYVKKTINKKFDFAIKPQSIEELIRHTKLVEFMLGEERLQEERGLDEAASAFVRLEEIKNIGKFKAKDILVEMRALQRFYLPAYLAYLREAVKNVRGVLDLNYHLIGENGLYNKLYKKGLVQKLLSEDDLAYAAGHTSSIPRAAWRLAILNSMPPSARLKDMDWSSIEYIDSATGEEHLFVQDDPLRGEEVVSNE